MAILVLSHFRFHMSGVTCHMLRFACHLSLTPIATATIPRPANSPIMHSRLVKFKKLQKAKKNSFKTANTQKGLKLCQYFQYTIGPEVASPLGSGVSKMAQTNTQTHNSWILRLRDFETVRSFLLFQKDTSFSQNKSHLKN